MIEYEDITIIKKKKQMSNGTWSLKVGSPIDRYSVGETIERNAWKGYLNKNQTFKSNIFVTVRKL